MIKLHLPITRYTPFDLKRVDSTDKNKIAKDKWKQIFDKFNVEPVLDTNTGMFVFDVSENNIEKMLNKKIISGIASKIRGVYWKSIANTDTFKNYLPRGLYTHLINYPITSEDNEIKLDINRTFYLNTKIENTDSLFNVLRAYKLFNPDVGYCQGMGYIVGMLLNHMNEEDTFFTLISMLEKYNLKEVYRDGLPALRMMCDILDKSIEDRLPRLHAHFNNNRINSSMYAVQWFMTLFTYNTTLKKAAPIWDLFFVKGIESLLAVSLSLLNMLEPKLLQLNFEMLIETLVSLGDINTKKVVKSAMIYLE